MTLMTTSNGSANISLAVAGELQHGRGRGDGFWPHQRSHPIAKIAQPHLDITGQTTVGSDATNVRSLFRQLADGGIAGQIGALGVPRSFQECQGTWALCSLGIAGVISSLS